MSKVYTVVKYGGQYEDKWDTVVAVCNTKELAKELKQRIENYYKDKPCDISEDEWQDMCDVYYDSEEEGEFLEILNKMFPKYTLKQLAEAERAYDYYDDYAGVYIEEIEYYESNSEFLDAANY